MLRTPRLIRTDAYTASGHMFTSDEAKRKSVYYCAFRKALTENKNLQLSFAQNDQRIIFTGLQNIVKNLFGDPLTHEEIDEAKEFFKARKAGPNGFSDFEFPEEEFRRCVDEFQGDFPLRISSLMEGTVVYPGTPLFKVENTVEGFGNLAAYFEPHLLHCWATSQRVTIARYWLEYLTLQIRSDHDISEEEARFFASLMCHDFGARAAMCSEENSTVAYQHLYCFPGTDTFEAAYAAWKDGAPSYVGSSVWALAHRIVQGFVEEKECYETIYENSPNHSFISMVADCYNYYNAVENYILPLAKKSVEENNGKVVVCRPDSGDPLEQILWTINLAIQNGLYEEKDGWKYATTLRFIEGDSMDFDTMRLIMDALRDRKWAPHGWGLFGVGGFLRNGLTRDNLSAKYALCQSGDRGVMKLSHTTGKSTFPNSGLRKTSSYYELTSNIEDTCMKIMYDEGTFMTDDFNTIQERILNQFNQYNPNGKITLSKDLQDQIKELKKTYLS